MKNKTNIIIFFILTLFFTGVVFLVDTYFFSNDLKNNSEEKHIEESIFSDEEILDKNTETKYLEIAKNIIKEKKEEVEKEKKNEIKKANVPVLNSPNVKKKAKIHFAFIPNKFKELEEKNKKDISEILFQKKIYSFLNNIAVLFYENRPDVRGKMKNRQVKIFGPQKMDEDEIIAIFIHEFSHYIDIYSLERKGGKDISNQFYNISWNSTKIIKQGLTQKDFVSGYSMTNKYEDFAESLTYYVLHNRDFLEKSIKSKILRKKYNFFNLVLFKSEIFKNTDFSKNNKVKNYYRDITKIHFSRKNFLQYLKKSI